MSKTTLFVGDLHLQAKLILPLVEKAIEKHNVERVIFMGDYVDQWNQNDSSQLYIDELTLLNKFRKKLIKKGKVEPVFLIGNHDMPYLIGIPEYYSVNNADTFDKVHDLLLRLQPQIAYKVGEDFVASHAGYVYESIREIPEWHFKPWLYSYTDESVKLQMQAGMSRGGLGTYGSVLWADFGDFERGSLKIERQVVGHTPQKTITNVRYVNNLNDNVNCICVDTFSLNQFYNPIGDGSMLLYKDNNFEIIKNPEWQTTELGLKRLLHFN